MSLPSLRSSNGQGETELNGNAVQEIKHPTDPIRSQGTAGLHNSKPKFKRCRGEGCFKRQRDPETYLPKRRNEESETGKSSKSNVVGLKVRDAGSVDKEEGVEMKIGGANNHDQLPRGNGKSQSVLN